MGDLKGKVAFVTGTASKRGMGRAVAMRLAKEGADVVVTDKFPAPKSMFPGDEGWKGLEDEVAEIQAMGRQSMAITLDVSSSREVDDAVNKTLAKFGKIDILVHCAAIRGPVGTPLVEHTEKDWQDCMNINVIGTFLISKAVAKHMIARGQGGKILIFASMAGTHGVKGSSAYCASKYATIGLVKSMALEVAPYHINVNAINPGAIITNLRDAAFAKMARDQGVSWEEAQQKDYKMMGSNIPWGRLGTVQEIANLAYFMVSDQSEYMTAETIGLTGGLI
ncbi:MAG TPA: SDR family oxidoreductase [Dehalococcoidales bacterium]|nr:SDR family oxidoreductase [Dehalococcoidales bacterium]